MADRHGLRRAEIAVALLAASLLAALVPVAVDGVRFHLHALASGRHPPTLYAIASLTIAAALAVSCARFAWSLARRWRAERRLLNPDGSGAYELLATDDFYAFTAGLWRPRTYLSQGALARLTDSELRMVLAHEASHVRRRDPLRLALADALGDAFGWLPGVRAAARSHATLAELAADADAARSPQDVQDLSQALLRMDATPGAGVLPQRVDHICGELQWDTVSRPLVRAGLAVLAALAALAVAMAVLPWHPAAFCTAAALALAPALLIPAALVSWRARQLLSGT